MSSTNSPCAACKFLRRKCPQDCVFAPYFPPDQPQKFANVHKIFGASNVSKILNELSTSQREDAVNSLAYEAEARIRDPVYGCVGLISVLQHRLKELQHDLHEARRELSKYIGQSCHPKFPPQPAPAFMAQQEQHNPGRPSLLPHMVLPMVGVQSKMSHMIRPEVTSESQQLQQHLYQGSFPQHFLHAQKLAAALVAREKQDMLRGYEQQDHMFNSRVDSACSTASAGFNDNYGSPAMSTSLALGFLESSYDMETEQTKPRFQLQGQQSLSLHPFLSEQSLEEKRSGCEKLVS